MNQMTFAARNVLDKLGKVVGSWETFEFYWQTYILSRLDRVEPDVYVVSYPKCGRTWLRVMLQKYLELQGHSLHFFHDKSLVGISGQQIVKFEHDQGNWVPAPLRKEQLRFQTSKYRDKRVLFMIRDPRDVLVSSWYHLTYRERIFRQDLSAFIRDDLVGVDKLIAFTNMWMENRHVPQSFLLLSYEQMHGDTAASFMQVLEFMDFGVDMTAVHQAVEASSFENMKRMESDGELKEPWMKPGAKSLGKSMKVRQGKIGSFRKELSEKDIAFLNTAIRRGLSPELSQYH